MKPKFMTYGEACQYLKRKLKIENRKNKNISNYGEFYLDCRTQLLKNPSNKQLPRFPNKFNPYQGYWTSLEAMFGLRKKELLTYKEAKLVLKARLAKEKKKTEPIISLSKLYRICRAERDLDPNLKQLPTGPNKTYTEFTNYSDLFGIKKTNKEELNFYQLKEFAIEEFRDNNPDSLIPSKFIKTLVPKFKGFSSINKHPRYEDIEHFLGIDNKYKSLRDVQDVFFHYVKEENRSKEAYKALAFCHPKLPTNPKCYKDWSCWESFLTGEDKDYYSFDDFKKKLKQLGAKHKIRIDPISYHFLLKCDPKLHEKPHIYYIDEWSSGTWRYLRKLNPELQDFYEFTTFNQKIIENDIQSLTELAAHVRSIPKTATKAKFPLEPLKQYNLKNFEELINFQYFDSLELINKYIFEDKIDNHHDLLSASLHDKRLIANKLRILCRTKGVKYYKRSEFDFLKKLGFEDWGNVAEEFVLEIKRSRKEKTSQLKKFLSYLVFKENLPQQPFQFFISSFSRPEFSELEKFSKYDSLKGLLLDFLSYVMDRYCYDIDPETNDKILLDTNLILPYANVVTEIRKNNRSESIKPVLPMKIMNRCADYLFPIDSINFEDLKNAQTLVGVDWVDIEEQRIDKSDPDCVYRKILRKHNGANLREVFQVWNPARTVALLFLLKTPLRGQQIMWLDSGEADDYKLITKSKTNFEWVKNDNPLAGMAKKEKGKCEQGVAKRLADENGDMTGIQMHITTNKTSNIEGGYDVAYFPEDLLYWVIKLREWQSKYNPLSKPTPWKDIHFHGGFSKGVVARREKQCFLFRTPNSKHNDNEKGSQPFRSTSFNLAKLLFLIQEPGESYASCHLNEYNSPYTTHSTRVSHITFLIFEAGVDPVTVAKLVGHASIVMTIYYAKKDSLQMRQELEAASANTKAIDNQQIRLSLVNDIDLKTQELVFDNENPALNPNNPRNMSVMDIGICPFGQSQCNEGQRIQITKTKFKSIPVEAGFLGRSNCPKCRFFITGPTFIAGLQGLTNKINLANFQVKTKIKELSEELKQYEDDKFDAIEKGIEHHSLEVQIHKIETQIEAEESLIVTYTSDLVVILRKLNESIQLLNNTKITEASSKLPLLIDESLHVSYEIEEVSEFRMLNEVSKFANFFVSGSDQTSFARHSQLVDKLLSMNGYKPILFYLDNKKQRILANQVVDLMRLRLGRMGYDTKRQQWQIIEGLANGKKLIETSEEEFILLDQELKTLGENRSLPDESLKLLGVNT